VWQPQSLAKKIKATKYGKNWQIFHSMLGGPQNDEV
jgi:hypothetical protein